MCEACGTLMIGATTKNGKVAPIEINPSPAGNTLLFKAPSAVDGNPETHCRTFAGFALGELQEQGVPMRLNHFASCPAAANFKTGATDGE